MGYEQREQRHFYLFLFFFITVVMAYVRMYTIWFCVVKVGEGMESDVRQYSLYLSLRCYLCSIRVSDLHAGCLSTGF